MHDISLNLYSLFIAIPASRSFRSRRGLETNRIHDSLKRAPNLCFGVRGRIVFVGIVVFALGGAGMIGNAENAMANNAVTQIANNGCQGACNGPPSTPDTPVIPSYLIYGLLAIGALAIVAGLATKGKKQDAT
jgi:hypothetical protein